MKRATKLSVLLVVAAAAIAVTFTGCPDLGFGKDDLYGTWKTLDFDANGNPVDRYTTTGSQAGTYSVTWKFDGNSENMFNGTGGTFRQHLVKYSGTGSVAAESFWYGEYAIKGNSGYSKGKLYLYYECGYNMRVGSASLDQLWDWTVNDFLDATDLTGLDDAKLTNNVAPVDGVKCYSYNDTVYIQIRREGNAVKCSDIEYFRFNLKDGSLYGYTRLLASTEAPNGDAIGGIYSQWGEAATTTVTSSNAHFAGGNKIANSCSWKGTSTRCMGRISARSTPDDPIWMCSSTTPNSEYFSGVDVGDDNDYADPDAEMRPEQ